MQHYSYPCRNHGGHASPKEWIGEISILDDTHGIEADVRARGSYFHLLLGRHQYGHYICIPNWGIGTELARLSDRYWNLENICHAYPRLSKTDAVSIVDAVYDLSQRYPGL